jgi:hypothetical protein
MKTANADANHSLETGSKRTRVSRTKSLRVAAASAVAFLGAFAGLAVVGVNPAGASTVDGVATIADPSGLNSLPSGGSTTQFTINLPASAACSGDTATDGYHVFSYLVPKGTNPTAVSFVNGFPSVDYGLFTSTGNYYGKANTAQTTGQVVSIPTNLEFAPLLSRGVTAATLESNGGVWESGIACANSSGTVTDYWNTQLTFTANGGDPNGFVWSATPGGPTSVPGAPKVGTVKAGHGSVAVKWTAPSSNGGSAITGYAITPYIGKTAEKVVKVGNVTSDTVTGLTNGSAYTFTVAATNSIGTGAASGHSASATPNGLYISTASLPKATKGKKYATVHLAEKNGVGTETWKASGLPSGITLTSAGVLSGTEKGGAKTYSVNFSVTDSSKPKKQTATKKISLVVAA